MSVRLLAALGVAVVLAGLGLGVLAGGLLGGPPPEPGLAAGPSSSAPTGSGDPSSPPAPTPSPTAAPTPRPTPRPTPQLVPAPLTGRLVPPEIAARHPIAVMIDDHRDARPQSGLSSASVVWHAPAEGGIPRYLAIFQEIQPVSIGPVRSARDYYVYWAAEWKALYAHTGGSPRALSLLRSEGSGQLVYNADEFRWARSFFRVDERFAPHNLYTDSARLRELATAVGASDGPSEPVWQFGPDLPEAFRPVGGSISVAYTANSITYAYDRATNTYRRSVSGEDPQVDAGNGAVVAPRNVVVMLMRFGPLNDGSNKKRLEADVVGSGTAWIATNGTTIEGTWRKDSQAGPTRFFDGAGQPVTLTVGQTFVQVLQTGSEVTVVAGGPPPRDEPPPAGGQVE